MIRTTIPDQRLTTKLVDFYLSSYNFYKIGPALTLHLLRLIQQNPKVRVKFVNSNNISARWFAAKDLGAALVLGHDPDPGVNYTATITVEFEINTLSIED